MTATQTTPLEQPATVSDGVTTQRGAQVPARRFDVRRAAAVALPAVTGALLVAATATDPGSGSEEGTEMIRVYADNVEMLQWHMTFLHFSYGLWGFIPLALLGLARARGRTLMNVAAVLGGLVVISMPGLMITDAFLVGIAGHTDVGTADAVGSDIIAQQWAMKTYVIPGLASMVLTLPFAFGALVRAGKARWWAIPLAVAALPVFVLSGTTLPGAIVAGLLLVGLSVIVAKAVRR